MILILFIYIFIITYFFYLDNIIQQYQPFYDYLKIAELENILKQKKPFTLFVSKNDPLGKFNSIEKDYLISKHGLKDLKLYFNYFIIDGSNYAINFPKGKSTCNFNSFIYLLFSFCYSLLFFVF